MRRHRIHKPAPNDECFYTVADFNVGVNLELYGRVYRLVSCDKFTDDFLRKLGVRVNEFEAMPDDPYTLHRSAVTLCINLLFFSDTRLLLILISSINL